MVKNNLENGFSKSLEKEFNLKKKLSEFKAQMDQMEKDIDPRFLEQFFRYKRETIALLSDNLAVIDSDIVKKEVARQNARVTRAFEIGSLELNKYTKTFLSEAANNSDYGQEWLAE